MPDRLDLVLRSPALHGLDSSFQRRERHDAQHNHFYDSRRLILILLTGPSHSHRRALIKCNIIGRVGRSDAPYRYVVTRNLLLHPVQPHRTRHHAQLLGLLPGPLATDGKERSPGHGHA